MYNSNTDSLGLILGVEVFFSIGHCSGALWDTLSQSGPITNIVSQWQHNIQLHTTLEHSVGDIQKANCSISLGPKNIEPM